MEAMFEAKAGLLYVERCVEIHAAQARLNGAKTVIGEAVRSWTGGPGEVRIETDRNRYVAASAVFCAGPWSDQLLRSIGIPLTVRRKPVIWYPTRDRRYSMDQGCPVFCFDTADGFFYGLPTLSGEQLKVAEHTGGEGIASADELDRTLHPRDESRVNRFVRTHLPDVVPTVAKSSICMYTMTPDQHFVIDRHPDHPNVVFAAGFSGHGFKFAPIVGSILADMVESGRTEEPIEFLSLSRAALRDSRPDRSKV